MAAREPERPRHFDDRGFTLIELLIGFAVTALLAGFLFSGLRIGTRSERTVTKQIERMSEIAAMHSFVRAQLANARPLSVQGQNAKGIVAFDGGANHVTFVGLLPGALAAGGLQSLDLGLLDHGRGRRSLVVRWRAYDPESAPAQTDFSGMAVLLDQLAAVEFNYFGSLDSTQPAAWYAEWVNRETLPSIVTLGVVFADGQAMPDCVIALRALPLVDTVRIGRDLRPCRRRAGHHRSRSRQSTCRRKAREALS